MKEICMTLMKEPFLRIRNGKKRFEYRKIKKHWINKFSKLECPFKITFVNGYSKDSARLKVTCYKITTIKNEIYKLHIKDIECIKDIESREQFLFEITKNYKPFKII